MKKIIFVVLAMIIAAFLVVTIRNQAALKAQKKDAASSTTDNSDAMKQKVLSFELEGLTDKGDKKWEVKGESAEAVSENEIRLDNIVAKAYGDDSEATITAKSGVYDKVKNSVRLEKDVNAVIENEPGSGSEAMGLSPAPQKEKAPADPAASDVKAKTSAAKERTKTVITCDGAVEFNYEQNLAYFNKNVKVESDYANIDADKITVHLEPKSKKMKEIVAEGNVKITKDDNVTYTDKAIYVEAEKRIILTGRPKLVIYQEGSAQDGNFLPDMGSVGK